MTPNLKILRKEILKELETARNDMRSSCKIPDGYAHGYTNGRIETLKDMLEMIETFGK